MPPCLIFGPFVGNGYQLANGLLLVQVVALGVLSLRRVFSAPREGAPRWMFYALMLAPALHQMNDERFFPSPDSAPFSSWGSSSLENAWTFSCARKVKSRLATFTRVTLLGAAGIACKQSFMVCLGLSAVLILWMTSAVAAQATPPAGADPRALAGAGHQGASCRRMDRARNPAQWVSFLSNHGAAIPVLWRVPVDAALSELNWIVMRARNPGVSPDQIMPGMAWLANWLRSLPNSITKPAEVSAALLVFTLALWPGRAGAQPDARCVLVLTAIPLLSIAYWLVTAPASIRRVSFLGAARIAHSGVCSGGRAERRGPRPGRLRRHRIDVLHSGRPAGPVEDLTQYPHAA